MRYGHLLAAFALVFSAQAASAGVILSDNFTNTVSETPALNWTGDGIFVPIPATPAKGLPSVDLVTSNTSYPSAYYPTLVPNSVNAPSYPSLYGLNAVDLDGSTGTGFAPAGSLESVKLFTAGSYLVQFYLAGNLRGAPGQTTTVHIGSDMITLNPNPVPNSQDYSLYSLVFNTLGGNLVFNDLGPATQQGTLLADVTVSYAVPEPSTWAMMVLGFAGVGFMAYRRKNKATAFRFA